MGTARPKPSKWSAGGLEIEGLSESISAIRRFDRDASNTILRAMRRETNVIRDQARNRMMRRPFGGTYKRKRPQIGTGGGQRERAIVLRRSRYPWAVGAELGSYVSRIPVRQGQGRYGTRAIPNRRMSRPHWATYKGFPARLDRGHSGTAVLPAIRMELPSWENVLVHELNDLMAGLLRREGVDVTKGR